MDYVTTQLVLTDTFAPVSIQTYITNTCPWVHSSGVINCFPGRSLGRIVNYMANALCDLIKCQNQAERYVIKHQRAELTHWPIKSWNNTTIDPTGLCAFGKTVQAPAGQSVERRNLQACACKCQATELTVLSTKYFTSKGLCLMVFLSWCTSGHCCYYFC